MKPDILAGQLSVLIQDLLGLLIEYPRDLRVTHQLHPGRIDFRIRPNINDQGRVVGRDGTHIRAIKLLLSRAGERYGIQVVAVLDEDETGRRVPDPLRPPSGLVASPIVPVRVLHSILGALTDKAPTIQVARSPSMPVEWQVAISPAGHADLDFLTDAAHEASPIEAICDLYKAVGKRNNVTIKIELAK